MSRHALILTAVVLALVHADTVPVHPRQLTTKHAAVDEGKSSSQPGAQTVYDAAGATYESGSDLAAIVGRNSVNVTTDSVSPHGSLPRTSWSLHGTVRGWINGSVGKGNGMDAGVVEMGTTRNVTDTGVMEMGNGTRVTDTGVMEMGNGTHAANASGAEMNRMHNTAAIYSRLETEDNSALSSASLAMSDPTSLPPNPSTSTATLTETNVPFNPSGLLTMRAPSSHVGLLTMRAPSRSTAFPTVTSSYDSAPSINPQTTANCTEPTAEASTAASLSTAVELPVSTATSQSSSSSVSSMLTESAKSASSIASSLSTELVSSIAPSSSAAPASPTASTAEASGSSNTGATTLSVEPTSVNGSINSTWSDMRNNASAALSSVTAAPSASATDIAPAAALTAIPHTAVNFLEVAPMTINHKVYYVITDVSHAKDSRSAESRPTGV